MPAPPGRPSSSSSSFFSLGHAENSAWLPQWCQLVSHGSSLAVFANVLFTEVGSLRVDLPHKPPMTWGRDQASHAYTGPARGTTLRTEAYGGPPWAAPPARKTFRGSWPAQPPVNRAPDCFRGGSPSPPRPRWPILRSCRGHRRGLRSLRLAPPPEGEECQAQVCGRGQAHPVPPLSHPLFRLSEVAFWPAVSFPVFEHPFSSEAY